MACTVGSEWVWCVQLVVMGMVCAVGSDVVCTVDSEWVWHVQLVVSRCGVCSW